MEMDTYSQKEEKKSRLYFYRHGRLLISLGNGGINENELKTFTILLLKEYENKKIIVNKRNAFIIAKHYYVLISNISKVKNIKLKVRLNKLKKELDIALKNYFCSINYNPLIIEDGEIKLIKSIWFGKYNHQYFLK